MLPGIDGFGVAAELRRAGQFVPVLMLTARGRPEDVLRGFESGADDYLPKPFELTILIARLRGLIRRREWLARDLEATTTTPATSVSAPSVNRQRDDGGAADLFTFGGKTIDFGTLELRADGRTV